MVRLNINTKHKYTARMQELWMREDMRGFCIGAALWPLLLIHSVIGWFLGAGDWRTCGRDCAASGMGATTQRKKLAYNVVASLKAFFGYPSNCYEKRVFCLLKPKGGKIFKIFLLFYLCISCTWCTFT